MPADLMLTLGAVFVAVALVAGFLASTVLTWAAPEQRRLRQMAASTPSGLVIGNTPLAEGLAGSRLATFVPKSPKEMGQIRRRLARAGYHSIKAVAVYSLAQMVLPVLFGLVPFFFLSFNPAWLVALLAAAIGYLVPGLVLDSLIRRRQKVIQNGLPDALDLVVVCLEAGSSLDQAIVKTGAELEMTYPALAEELRMLTVETRAGKPRLEAFRNFAQRTGVEDVRALSAMLIQTDKFGTSVSQALRVHAGTARSKRRQRAEERAAKVGVKLVFPLVFCLFPAFYVVTLGPAVIQFIKVFSQ